MLKFNEDNNLLYDDYHTILKNAVNDDSITTDLFDTTEDSGSTSSLNNKNIQRKICMNNELSEGTDNEYYNKLPVYEYNYDNVRYHFNENIDNDKIFIGVWFDADTCIVVYNAMTRWAMKQVVYGSPDYKQVAEEIITALTAVGIPASSIIASLTSNISNVWKAFLGLFDSGPLGVIAAIVILLVVAFCIFCFAAMIYHGSRQEGFACGYEVNGRGWFCGAV